MLVFDVEMISFAPPTPPRLDVKAPPPTPKDREWLAYKVIKPGTGTRHPRATDEVTVHYSGWTTDGKMFDSSVTRGEPATFPLNGVIAGWTEGVQLMVEGETTRFWIPEALAYRGQRAPYGMLVFDVELILRSSRQFRAWAGQLRPLARARGSCGTQRYCRMILSWPSGVHAVIAGWRLRAAL